MELSFEPASAEETAEAAASASPRSHFAERPPAGLRGAPLTPAREGAAAPGTAAGARLRKALDRLVAGAFGP